MPQPTRRRVSTPARARTARGPGTNDPPGPGVAYAVFLREARAD